MGQLLEQLAQVPSTARGRWPWRLRSGCTDPSPSRADPVAPASDRPARGGRAPSAACWSSTRDAPSAASSRAEPTRSEWPVIPSTAAARLRRYRSRCGGAPGPWTRTGPALAPFTRRRRARVRARQQPARTTGGLPVHSARTEGTGCRFVDVGAFQCSRPAFAGPRRAL